MTISEALNWMQKNHPDRSACAEKSGWYHPRNTDDDKRPPATYTVSVQPGFNDTPCQLFGGPSLEECIRKIQDVTREPIEATPNNE